MHLKSLLESLLSSSSRFSELNGLRLDSFGDCQSDLGFSCTMVILAHSAPVYPQMISELQLEIPSYIYVQTVFFSP